jgi:hypothetical protein
MKNESVTINGIEYIPKDSQNELCEKYKGLKYVIVRTYSAGVFAGYLKERKGKEGILLKSRRLWKWSGAASLSQLSVDGVSLPNECKFPCEIEGEHELTEIIEVIPVTKKAKLSINSVPIWKE